jgi:hypothetical protein
VPEPVISALIGAAATGIVNAMTADAWHVSARKIAAVLARGRPAEESAYLAQLNDDRRDIRTRSGGRRAQTRARVEARWAAVVGEFAQASPQAERALRELGELLSASVSNDETTGSRNSSSAQASFGGMVSQGSLNSPQVSGNGNRVVGRDDNSSHTANSHNVSNSGNTHYGGILVAVVAVIAIIWGGTKVYQSVVADDPSSGLSADATCREWLQADPAVQRQSALTAATQAGNKEAASDGFIVQNTQYNCGYNPDMTLRQLFAVKSKG